MASLAASFADALRGFPAVFPTLYPGMVELGERTGRRFRLSDRVKVQLARVDMEQNKIDFRLLDVAPRGGKDFIAYGTPQDMPDPVARAIEGLLDQVSRVLLRFHAPVAEEVEYLVREGYAARTSAEAKAAYLATLRDIRRSAPPAPSMFGRLPRTCVRFAMFFA